MKTSLKLLTLAGVLCAGILTLHADDKKIQGGPKGGRGSGGRGRQDVVGACVGARRDPHRLRSLVTG